MKINFVYFLLSFLVFLGSCECVEQETVCNEIPKIELINKASKQDLIIGVNPKYFIDSIFFRTPEENNFLKIPYDSSKGKMQLILPLQDTVYLKLNYKEIDTLFINYKYNGHKSFCCKSGVRHAIALEDNGEQATKERNIFLIKK